MSRWERFWWAFRQANFYGFGFGLQQGWRFATEPGRILCLSRQVQRQFDRTMHKELKRKGAGKLAR